MAARRQPAAQNQSHPGQVWREVCGALRGMSMCFFFSSTENTSKPNPNNFIQCRRFSFIALLIPEPIAVLGGVWCSDWSDLSHMRSPGTVGGGSTQPSAPVLSVREERVSSKEVSQIPLLWRRGIERWEAKHRLSALINPPQNAPQQRELCGYTCLST